jgi:hypothetical protein
MRVEAHRFDRGEYAVKFIIALVALFISLSSDAGEQVSRWDTGATCQPHRPGHRCVEYQAVLELHRIGDDYCGLISETTDEHSPEAWFRGRRDERGVLVQFVDSFQYGGDAFGWARIDIDGNRLAWTVLLRPDGGRIAGERRFHFSPTPKKRGDAGAISCTELEYRSSGLTVHLPQTPEAASSARH